MKTCGAVTPFLYTIIVHPPGPDGVYLATVPAFAGAVGDGATEDEAVAMARESVELMIEVMTEHGDPIPTPDSRSWELTLHVPSSGPTPRGIR